MIPKGDIRNLDMGYLGPRGHTNRADNSQEEGYIRGGFHCIHDLPTQKACENNVGKIFFESTTQSRPQLNGGILLMTMAGHFPRNHLLYSAGKSADVTENLFDCAQGRLYGALFLYNCYPGLIHPGPRLGSRRTRSSHTDTCVGDPKRGNE